MKVLKLRKKLHWIGLVLLEHGDGWMVTNNGTAKDLFEAEFETLEAVQMWLDGPGRRLSEVESDEFDQEWAGWCQKLNNNKR